MTVEKKAPQTIIVGIDGSEGSSRALAWAMSHARRHPGAVVQPVVAVRLSMLESESPLLHGSRKASDIEADAAEFLANVLASSESDSSDEESVEVRDVELVIGHPGRELVERASTADLLVLGSRGRGGITSALLGSVSSHCVAASTIPVAVIPDTESVELPVDPKVVVGIDGSLAADDAAVWARRQFPESTVTLLRAWHEPTFYLVEPVALPRIDFEPAARAEFERHVERISRLLEPEERPFEAALAMGDARNVLADAPADLLVIGAQEFHGLRRAVLGSVAQAVLHHLRRPTVFVSSETDNE